MKKESGSARPRLGRKEIQERRAPKSSSVLISAQFSDYARIAVEHFGTSAPAADLESIARLVARMRQGESIGGKGSQAVRALTRAASAASLAAKHVRTIDLLTLVEAMRCPAKGEADAPYWAAIDDVNRMAAVDALDVLLVKLDRLDEGLRARARQVPRERRGRTPRSGVLAFALEALEHLWWRYRSQVPTQSTARGGFLALAEDVLTAAPCFFATGSVGKAVRAYLARDDRPALAATRPPAPTATATVRSVVVVGVEDPVLQALARQHADAGDRVVATATPDRVAAVQADLGEGIPVKPFALTTIPHAEDLASLGAGPLDLLLIGGLTGGTGVIAADGPEDFNRVDLAGQAAAALAVAPVLVAIVQALRPRLLQSKGAARLVVLTSALASAAKGRLAGGYAATPAYAAIQALVGLWARDLGSEGIVVVGMHAGWGQREDGTPNRHTLPLATATVMGETIGRFGEREHGRLVDLHGGIEPA